MYSVTAEISSEQDHFTQWNTVSVSGEPLNCYSSSQI